MFPIAYWLSGQMETDLSNKAVWENEEAVSHEYFRPRDTRGTNPFSHFLLISVGPNARSAADRTLMNAL